MAFMLAGGFPMVFIVVFGAVALIGALRFALTPEPGRVGAVLAYGGSVLFAAVAGTAFDTTFVARAVVGVDEADQAHRWLILVVGLSESLSPLILGSAILSVVALLVAVGMRRLPVDH
ncbi:MAG: hypothetical protein H6738_01700 [Alphaproteobacteria bacterium]|nr:hypothetical protein [Alphaproteobacteria bacterium]MCB9695482.1 hypothetical protein [Alphaproteobacteria bacterium]